MGCDNAAVALKETILKFLEEKGVHAEDMGCNSDQDTTYYPTIAQRVCQRIIDSKATGPGNPAVRDRNWNVYDGKQMQRNSGRCVP